MNWGRAETRLNAKRIVIQLDSCLWQIHVCERKTCSQTSHDEVHFFIVRFCHLLYEKLYLVKKKLKIRNWKYGNLKVCYCCFFQDQPESAPPVIDEQEAEELLADAEEGVERDFPTAEAEDLMRSPSPIQQPVKKKSSRKKREKTSPGAAHHKRKK